MYSLYSGLYGEEEVNRRIAEVYNSVGETVIWTSGGGEPP